MIRHLIPRIDAGPWGGAALTNNGSRTGDEAIGRSFAFQWLGFMFEIGVGVVAPRPAAPTCDMLPDDVTLDQAARHLGIIETPFNRVSIAGQLVRAGFKPRHRNAGGVMSTRYIRSAPK